MNSEIFERRFRVVLRWLALGVCIAVALNAVGAWWFWEIRAPAHGWERSELQLLNARLTLLWAFAALALGMALFCAVKSLPKISRRSMTLLLLALALGAAPYLIRVLVLT